jgi:hypothetical protein
MAEEAIAEKSRSVAKEVERYLLSHPDLKKENFMQDAVLKSIGIQKVGQMGIPVLFPRFLRPNPAVSGYTQKKSSRDGYCLGHTEDPRGWI